MWEEVLMVYY